MILTNYGEDWKMTNKKNGVVHKTYSIFSISWADLLTKQLKYLPECSSDLNS